VAPGQTAARRLLACRHQPECVVLVYDITPKVFQDTRDPLKFHLADRHQVILNKPAVLITPENVVTSIISRVDIGMPRVDRDIAGFQLLTVSRSKLCGGSSKCTRTLWGGGSLHG
jgi:hypothetical protein